VAVVITDALVDFMVAALVVPLVWVAPMTMLAVLGMCVMTLLAAAGWRWLS
jgi:hypothetical protein